VLFNLRDEKTKQYPKRYCHPRQEGPEIKSAFSQQAGCFNQH
jgi:hypothetical protein